jgi:hypothetical protein
MTNHLLFNRAEIVRSLPLFIEGALKSIPVPVSIFQFKFTKAFILVQGIEDLAECSTLSAVSGKVKYGISFQHENGSRK